MVLGSLHFVQKRQWLGETGQKGFCGAETTEDESKGGETEKNKGIEAEGTETGAGETKGTTTWPSADIVSRAAFRVFSEIRALY